MSGCAWALFTSALNGVCSPLFADELVAAEERCDPPEHRHGDRQAQGDDPQAHGRDAGERHEDPQQAMGEPEHERRGLRAADREGAQQQRQVTQEWVNDTPSDA